ncbi:MAG: MFS transporter [Candidatus Amulumruptor caecigallinarius]|nr:MFS transporter [Candidatus Amulumruptor caecigallinarius]MCM1397687.1 MFS transporter [Candidatus Amulumruptor caecigallinarius]MCM1454684.1 MFS transporter [bacterium]
MRQKPDLGFWKLWNLSFGFFGVQIAYALQSANVSRIFATLGADPHDLSYFWILPPLMGLIVQPIVGSASDKTWNRFGRRLPYLIFGALVAIIVMCLLPNAGSFGLAVSSAILVGLIALMLLDTSINMAMQPFKMLVGDMVNEKQKGLAYSIQSFLCNAGSIVGYVFPFLLTWMGFRNTAAEGQIPQTVIYSFYIGAAILLVCVVYSLAKIKEWPPQLYAEYNGGAEATTAEGSEKKKENLLSLLVKAPSTFWTVGIVQFFCWFAFLFMWTYTNGTIAEKCFNTPSIQRIQGINQVGPNDEINATYNAKFILSSDSALMVEKGKAVAAGIVTNDGRFFSADMVEIVRPTQPTDTLLIGGLITTVNGQPKYDFGQDIATDGGFLVLNHNQNLDGVTNFHFVDRLSRMHGNAKLLLCDIYTHDPKTGELYLEGVKEVTLSDADKANYAYTVELNTESHQYNDAGNWVGILFAVQAVGSVLWAVALPMFRNRKFSYTLSLLIGAAGFITAGIFTNQYLLFISFLMIGCAWAAMLAWPFTILTNSLKGGNIGAYLGLFNCSICIPQIVAALLGGVILAALSTPGQVAPQYAMMIIAGIALVIGSICVVFIKEGKSDKQ